MKYVSVIIIAPVKNKIAHFITLLFLTCCFSAWVGNVIDCSNRSVKMMFCSAEEQEKKTEKIEETKVKIATGFDTFSFDTHLNTEVRNLISFNHQLPVSGYHLRIPSPPPDSLV